MQRPGYPVAVEIARYVWKNTDPMEAHSKPLDPFDDLDDLIVTSPTGQDNEVSKFHSHHQKG